MSLTMSQGGGSAQTWYNTTGIQNLIQWSCCLWTPYDGLAGASPCTLFSGCSTTNGGGYILGAAVNVGTGVLSFFNSGSYITIRSGALVSNKPFFLGVTVIDSNWYAYTRYYDESSFTTATSTHGAPTNQPMLSWNFGDHNSVNQTWSGKMDKMKLWGAPISDAQMYNESLFRSPVATWSLIGWWPCDDSATESVAITNKAGGTYTLSNNAAGETVNTSQLVTQTNWVIPN